MIEVVKQQYANLLVHVLVWGLVLFFPFLVSDANNQYKIGPLPGFYFTLSGVIHMIIFYANAFFLYPKLLNQSFWWSYIVFAILLIFFSVKMKFYILESWFSDSPEARSHVLFPSLMVFTVSIFFAIFVERIRAEKERKENEAMQLGMELKFLRSQINPHFLFNILTNLVSLARNKSDRLESSLLMLSGLMRYMLYEADKKISIQQEVEYLENFITLQKLRFERDAKILFSTELSPEQAHYSIEPMLLIPFVENPFKHGIGVDQPFIDINLAVRGGELVFQVKNKFDHDEDARKEASSGLGLNNVRARLELLYPEKHDLVVHTEENLFSINLTLKLQ